MTDEQNRLTLFLEFLKLLIALHLEEYISHGQRFIYNQYLRINVDRHGERQTHEHTGRIRLDRLMDEVSDVRKCKD